MIERRIPTREEVLAYLHERRNWRRWGQDDQVGAINLITPEKKVKAAALVRSGRSVSLSRPFPKEPRHGNPHPAQHWMKTVPRGEGAPAVDRRQVVMPDGVELAAEAPEEITVASVVLPTKVEEPEIEEETELVGEEGEELVRTSYGAANYERLLALKTRYDPTNLFRLNQNIDPRDAESDTGA